MFVQFRTRAKLGTPLCWIVSHKKDSKTVAGGAMKKVAVVPWQRRRVKRRDSMFQGSGVACGACVYGIVLLASKRLHLGDAAMLKSTGEC